MDQTYYEDSLSRAPSNLLKESNNADLTEAGLLFKAQVLSENYCRALKFPKRKVLVVNKRKINEVNIVLYNIVILNLLKVDMSLQYMTGIFAMLTYSTYLCKPEHCTSESMNEASKEAYNKNVTEKIWCIDVL